MSALKPDVDGAHDLGTTTLRWGALHVDTITTATSAQGGSDCTVGTNLIVTGNLTVNGDTTTLNTSTLNVEDLHITVANGAADSAAADGAGIIVDGASATLLYDHTGTQWEFNKNVETAGSLLPEGAGKANFNLGAVAQPWNDLFLSSGGVINFANTEDPIDGSDLTLTHSANLLKITGGNTRVDRLEIDSAADYIDVNTDLTLTAAAGIVLDAVTDIVLDADGDDITFKAGTGDTTGLKWTQSNSGDWTNLVGTQDKDLIFQVNDGGAATEVMRLDGDVSSLLMAGTKKITFGDAGSFVHQSANGKLAISSDGAAADAVVVTTSNAAGGIDIDAGTGGIAIDSTGSYAITAAGNSTISTTGTGTLTIDSGGALVIDTDGTDAISLGVEAAAKTITVGNDASTKVDINALAIELDSAGSILLDSATTTDIDAAGILSINASAAAINIGNDAVAQPINIGTGAAARTITVGEDASTKVDVNALAIELDAGTSGFTIDGAAASSVSTSDGALTVNGKTGLNLQEDGTSVIAIDTNRDVLFSQTGGATGDPDVEFDGYVRFDGTAEFDGSVQVDGNLTANNPVSVQNTLTVGVDDTGFDVKLFGATSGQYLLWDESADELVLAGDSKLSFHDAAGGENIIASSDGHLEVNAGTTLDMTAPTVDINASTAVTVESATFTLGSVDVTTDLNPTLTIQHTGDNANGGTLKFVKDKGAAGAQGDDAGVIQFFADNAAQEQTEFARVTAEVQTATDGQEGGKLSLSVAEHDGAMTAGLVLTEGSTDGVIDVAIGAGSGSTTTIAGNLTVSGTTTTVNSTELTVTDDLITVSKGNDTVANANGSGLEIDVDGGTNIHWKYVHANTALSANTDIDVDTGKVFRVNGTEVLSADGAKKVQSVVSGDVTTSGLAHSGGVLSVSVNGLTALGSAGMHQTEDFVMISDDGTTKKISFSNFEDSIFGNVSGDATVAAGGALTIAAGAVEHGMLAEDIISGQAELAHADIVDADELMISDAGTIKRVGVDSLRDHYFGVVSGDIAIADAGAATIQANAVEGSMLNNNVVSGQTEHTGAIDDTDEFLISDAGTVKRTDFSVLRDAVFADVSGDATVAAGGALTIAAGAVENAMLANNHITVAGDSGSQDIHLNDTLTISGTAGEIETSVSGDTITIGLPNNVDVDGTLTAVGLSSLDGGININDQVTIASGNGDYLSTNGDLNLTNGNLTLTSGDLEVGGDLTVSSALSSNGSTLTIKDSHVLFASTGANNISAGQTFDMGFYAKRDSASASSHVGLIYDNEASGAKWRLHEGLSGPDGITGKFNFSGSTPSALELGELIVGTDDDDADRKITFGHTTVKTVMGIDDDQDVFAIHTGSDFVAANDLEIDGSGNVTLGNGGLTTNGKIIHAVTETTSAVYTVDNDQDDYIIDANHTITLIDATAGRELIIVNTSGGNLTVTTSANSKLIIDTAETAVASNYTLPDKTALKIIGVGGHWYSI
jgi:hypothetical protein